MQHKLFENSNRLVLKSCRIKLYFCILLEAFARIRGNGDEFCNTNPVDNGVAIEKEFPHIAIIEAKVEKVIGRFKILRIDTKCAGSLITKKLVVTAQTCVNSTRHLAANIKFGMLIFNETRSIKSIEISQNDMVSEKHLTVLKLPEEIEINEFIMPAKIPTSTFDTLIDEKVILSGWTGFRYECNQQMRKWFLRKMLFRSCGDNLMCLNELDIINYREVKHFNGNILLSNQIKYLRRC